MMIGGIGLTHRVIRSFSLFGMGARLNGPPGDVWVLGVWGHEAERARA